MGDIIVLSVLGIVVAAVVRSMWKNHKNGGGCYGCSKKCNGKCSCHSNIM